MHGPKHFGGATWMGGGNGVTSLSTEDTRAGEGIYGGEEDRRLSGGPRPLKPIDAFLALPKCVEVD